MTTILEILSILESVRHGSLSRVQRVEGQLINDFHKLKESQI